MPPIGEGRPPLAAASSASPAAFSSSVERTKQRSRRMYVSFKQSVLTATGAHHDKLFQSTEGVVAASDDQTDQDSGDNPMHGGKPSSAPQHASFATGGPGIHSLHSSSSLEAFSKYGTNASFHTGAGKHRNNDKYHHHQHHGNSLSGFSTTNMLSERGENGEPKITDDDDYAYLPHQNIDEALQSLHHQELHPRHDSSSIVPQMGSSIEPTIVHDWILDGHPTVWEQQVKQTNKLLEELDGTADSNSWEALEERLMLEAGLIGQQEYHFADGFDVPTDEDIMAAFGNNKPTSNEETMTMPISRRGPTIVELPPLPPVKGQHITDQNHDSQESILAVSSENQETNRGGGNDDSSDDWAQFGEFQSGAVDDEHILVNEHFNDQAPSSQIGQAEQPRIHPTIDASSKTTADDLHGSANHSRGATANDSGRIEEEKKDDPVHSSASQPHTAHSISSNLAATPPSHTSLAQSHSFTSSLSPVAPAAVASQATSASQQSQSRGRCATESRKSNETTTIPSTIRVQPSKQEHGVLYSENSTIGDRAAPLSSPSLTTIYQFRRPLSFSSPMSSFMFSPTDLESPEGRFLRRRQSSGQIPSTQHPSDKTKYANTTRIKSKRLFASSRGNHEKIDSDTSHATIPQRYFDAEGEEADDTAETLNAISWEWIPFWQYPHLLYSPMITETTIGNHDFGGMESNIPLVHEQITSRLCDLDASLKYVQTQLLHTIQPHVDTLQHANITTYDIIKNMKLAQVYLERSKVSVDKARGHEDDGGGLLGGLALLDAWDQQESYQQMATLLQKLRGIFDLEKELDRRIELFTVRNISRSAALAECRGIIQLATEWKDVVHATESYLGSLRCLQESRDRCDTILSCSFFMRICALLESNVVRACREAPHGKGSKAFDSMEYETLIEVFLLLCECCDSDEETTKMIRAWVTTIQTALLVEVDRSFAFALLDPSVPLVPSNIDDTPTYFDHDGHTRKGRGIQDDRSDRACDMDADIDADMDADFPDFEKELVILNTQLQQRWGDAACLQNILYSLITIRFDFEGASKHQIAGVWHRLILLLTNVLRGHSVILRWHQTHPQQADENSIVSSSLKELSCRRPSVWHRCLKVLDKCLEEYLKFSTSRKLFESVQTSTGRESVVDFAWQEDLAAVEDLEKLAFHYLSMRSLYLGASSQECAKTTVSTSPAGPSNSPTASIFPSSPSSPSSSSSSGIEASLLSKIETLKKQHLRSVHVEAMNTMGVMLWRENWALIPLEALNEHEHEHELDYEHRTEVSAFIFPTDQVFLSRLQQPVEASSLHRSCCTEIIDEAMLGLQTAGKHDVSNVSDDASTADPNVPRALSAFPVDSNPFAMDLHDSSPCQNNDSDDPSTSASASVDDNIPDLLKTNTSFEGCVALLKLYCDIESLKNAPLIPTSIHSGMLIWSWRLVTMLQRLPSLADGIVRIFTDINDLYLTTVFRLCVGDSASERIVLAMDDPGRASVLALEHGRHAQSANSPMFGFRRRSETKIPTTPTHTVANISTTIDAEICFPLASELSDREQLREFIMDSQKRLEEVVKLDLVDQWISDPAQSTSDVPLEYAGEVARVLEKRIAASWSCIFVAKIVTLSSWLVLAIDSGEQVGAAASFGHFHEYADKVAKVVPIFVSVANAISSVRSLGPRRILEEIITLGPVWKEQVLHEQANDYVDSMCDTSAFIWYTLSSGNRLGAQVVDSAWSCLMEASYLIILEGFSRLPHCSTEGRSLMSMDVSFFRSGTSPASVLSRLERLAIPCVRQAPTVSLQRGMAYVDTYIKTHYLPRKDIVQWIYENHRTYQLSHAVALIVASFYGDRNTKDLQRYIKEAISIYDYNTGSG